MGVRTYGSPSLLLIHNRGGFGRRALLQIVDVVDGGYEFGPIRPGFWAVVSSDYEGDTVTFYYFFEEKLEDGLRIQLRDGFTEYELIAHKEERYQFNQINTREEFLLQSGDVARLADRIGTPNERNLDAEQLLLAMRGVR